MGCYVLIKYVGVNKGLLHPQLASNFTCYLLATELVIPLMRRIEEPAQTLPSLFDT